MASVCMCLCVYVFFVLFCHDSNLLLPTKVCSNILFWRRILWLLYISQCYVVGGCHGKGFSLLLPFSPGNLFKQSLQQQTPLTLIISGLDENTIFCRIWLKGENYSVR